MLRVANFALNLAGGAALLLLMPPETSGSIFGFCVVAIVFTCVVTAWGFNKLHVEGSVDLAATTLIWGGGVGLAMAMSKFLSPEATVVIGIATVLSAAVVALVQGGVAAKPEHRDWPSRLVAYLGPLMSLATIFALLYAIGFWREGPKPSSKEGAWFAIVSLVIYGLGVIFAKAAANTARLGAYLAGSAMAWITVATLTLIVIGQGRTLGFWSISLPLGLAFVMTEGATIGRILNATSEE